MTFEISDQRHGERMHRAQLALTDVSIVESHALQMRYKLNVKNQYLRVYLAQADDALL